MRKFSKRPVNRNAFQEQPKVCEKADILEKAGYLKELDESGNFLAIAI